MTRPELVKACAEKMGRFNWLQATKEELSRVLETGNVPETWANGAPTDSKGSIPQSATHPAFAGGDAEAALGALAAALSGRLLAPVAEPQGVDEDAVEAIARRIVAETIGQRTTRLEVTRRGEVVSSVENPHKALADLITVLSTGLPVWLAGPTGSGKTHGASMAATALGLRFIPYSVGPQTSKSDLLGYFDANGRYVPSHFRWAYEYGHTCATVPAESVQADYILNRDDDPIAWLQRIMQKEGGAP